MAAGLRYLRRDRPMGLLVVVVSAMLAFLGVTMVAELFLAERVLHGGTTGYALLITAWTGGMTLGTVIAGRLPSRLLAPGVVIGLVVLGAGCRRRSALARSCGWPSPPTGSVGWAMGYSSSGPAPSSSNVPPPTSLVGPLPSSAA